MLNHLFNLSADERLFLAEMNRRFPHLVPAFEELTGIEPEDRLGWARSKLHSVPRTGYLLRGVPEDAVETVGAHVEAAGKLAEQWVPGECDKSKIILMIAIHDVGEAVVGDFTIHDPITAAEKRQLEEMAIRLIFAHDPHGHHAVWQEFEYGHSHEARIASDIERAQILFRSLAYEEQFPHLTNALDDFWTNLAGTWHTDTGQAMYDHALSQKKNPPNPSKPLPRFR